MGYSDIKKKRQQSNAVGSHSCASIPRGEMVPKYSLYFVLAAIAAALVCMSIQGRVIWPNMIVAGIGFASVFVLVWGGSEWLVEKQRRKEMEEASLAEKGERDALREELIAWAKELERNGGLTPVSVDISLHADECAFYKSSVHLFEVRAVRVTHHVGGAVRVSRRTSLGGGRSVSESHDEWRPITRGTLYVTNKRVVFVGEKQSRVVDLKNIVSVNGGYGMLEVVSDNRAKSMRYTVDNWGIAKMTLSHLLRMQGESLQSIMYGSKRSEGSCLCHIPQAEISNPYENGIDHSTIRLLRSLENAVEKTPTLRRLDDMIQVPDAVRALFTCSCFPAALCSAVFQDALKCHLDLGHAISDLNNENGFGLLSVVWFLTIPNAVDNLHMLTTNNKVYEQIVGIATLLCEKYKPHVVSQGNNMVSISVFRKFAEPVLAEEYASAFCEWAQAIASADGTITQEEQQWLQHLATICG